MGIRNFFDLFRSLLKRIELSSLRGKRVGIDGYIWMHKAKYADFELAFSPDSTRYVDYFMQNIAALTKHGIIPIVVFDGGKLGNKNAEEEKREYAKFKTLETAQKLIEFGDNKMRDKGIKLRLASVDINPEMVHNVLIKLNEQNIEYIVAPYEADPQLAYLDKIGYVDFVMTEDSDLCAYGCRDVLYKFSKSLSYCMHMHVADVIVGFESYNQYLEFCIMCGCDYFKLPKIGAKSALKLIRKYRHFIDIPDIETKWFIPFFCAKYTFINQTVYCPYSKSNVSLNNFEKIGINVIHRVAPNKTFRSYEISTFNKFETDSKISALLSGKKHEKVIAQLIACGSVDPITLKIMEMQ